MLSYDLINYLKKVENFIKENENIFSYIKKFYEITHQELTYYDTISKLDIKIKSFYLDFIKFNEKIDYLEVEESYLKEVSYFKTLKQFINTIENSIENILDLGFKNNLSLLYGDNKNKVNKELLNINSNGRELFKFMKTISNDLISLQNSELLLTKKFKLNDTQKIVTLFLYSNETFSSFINKLVAFQNLYSEICEVANIKDELQIIKIESGSILMKLAGNAKVIGVIIDFTKKTLHYFYRNYTKEGKISNIPKDIKSLDSIIELKKSLNNIGIETSELDKTIEKNAVAISNNLNKLLVGEAKVKIDNEEISISKELEEQEKYLKETQKHLLEDKEKKSE